MAVLYVCILVDVVNIPATSVILPYFICLPVPAWNALGVQIKMKSLISFEKLVVISIVN